jgi:hypothetical protein
VNRVRKLQSPDHTTHSRRSAANTRTKVFTERKNLNPDSNDNKRNDRSASIMGFGIAIGASTDVALGVAMDNKAVGLALGIGVGTIIGAALGQRQQGSDDDDSSVE